MAIIQVVFQSSQGNSNLQELRKDAEASFHVLEVYEFSFLGLSVIGLKFEMNELSIDYFIKELSMLKEKYCVFQLSLNRVFNEKHEPRVEC